MSEEKIDQDARRLNAAKIRMLVGLAVVLLVGGGAVFAVLRPATSLADKVAHKIAATSSTQIAEEDQSIPVVDGALLARTQDLKGMGATAAEMEGVKSFSFAAVSEQKDGDLKLFARRLDDPKWMSNGFKTTVPSAGLIFPQDISLGAVSIDHRQPINALGFVPVPPGKSVCLYLSWEFRQRPDLLYKFGPQDLTGLEAPSTNAGFVLPKIKNWSRLTEFSFFNSLLKAMPGFEHEDESIVTPSDLPAVEQLTGLKSLGLCGTRLTGQQVLEMPILKKLETLKLKRVQDIQPLIEGLPALENLKELWLISEGTSDDQIEILANMKNLTTLRIRRSKLTPASLKYFAQMSALKNLILDRNNWTAEEKINFQNVLKAKGCICQFESLMDRTYWPAIKNIDDR